jgi:hypothetical protein
MQGPRGKLGDHIYNPLWIKKFRVYDVIGGLVRLLPRFI